MYRGGGVHGNAEQFKAEQTGSGLSEQLHACM